MIINYFIKVQSQIQCKSCVCDFSQLHTIEDEWNDLHNKSAFKSPLLTFKFISLWYECFSSPNQVRIYRITFDGRTIGFLPLVLRKTNTVKVLSSLSNDHCFHSEPLVQQGVELLFSKLAMAEIIRDETAWDIFHHKFSYSFSYVPGLFPDNLLNKTGLPWYRYVHPTYTVLLDKPFKKYFRYELSSNAKKNFMRFRNRLSKSGFWKVLHYQGQDAIKQWLKFVEIEDSGWKGSAGSSIKRLDSAFKRYYDGFIRILAERKALHIYFLELNSEFIAGVFGYVDGDIFHWAKTGYNERFKEFSPSNVLIIHILEDLRNNFPEIRRFHMFPWDYGYKHRYTNEDSSCIDTLIFNKTLRAKMAYVLFLIKRTIKNYIKK